MNTSPIIESAPAGFIHLRAYEMSYLRLLTARSPWTSASGERIKGATPQ